MIKSWFSSQRKILKFLNKTGNHKLLLTSGLSVYLFDWLIYCQDKSSRDILCQGVRELRSLYIYVSIFCLVVPKEVFLCSRSYWIQIFFCTRFYWIPIILAYFRIEYKYFLHTVELNTHIFCILSYWIQIIFAHGPIEYQHILHLVYIFW